jgi:hypothetical protein
MAKPLLCCMKMNQRMNLLNVGRRNVLGVFFLIILFVGISIWAKRGRFEILITHLALNQITLKEEGIVLGFMFYSNCAPFHEPLLGEVWDSTDEHHVHALLLVDALLQIACNAELYNIILSAVLKGHACNIVEKLKDDPNIGESGLWIHLKRRP